MKEFEILKRNGRVPTTEIILRFLDQFKTKKDMTDLLTKIFRYLGDHGIVAATALEVTKDKSGEPSNRVHSHILFDDKDTPRGKKNLIALFDKACRLRGLERGEDIKIGYKTLTKKIFTFDYFVKYGKHVKTIPLFQKGLLIQKFRYIGRWFTKPKKQLWAEYVEEMKKKYAEKNRSARSRFIFGTDRASFF
ncbi:MAG: hypothetical protein ACRC2T_17705 [Thermoguttaceae bacterium]